LQAVFEKSERDSYSEYRFAQPSPINNYIRVLFIVNIDSGPMWTAGESSSDLPDDGWARYPFASGPHRLRQYNKNIIKKI
jgi:hypothetical protein